MSQQKENLFAKLDPDEMDTEARHFKTRETDSTPGPSSWGSEKTVSLTSSILSMISEIASVIVSETLDRTSSDIAELMQSIARWGAEERSKSETDHEDDGGKYSADFCINQKVKRHLKRFFGLRRVFAEHKGETVEDTKKDTEEDSTQAPAGQDGHRAPTGDSSPGRKVVKRMKSAWKRYFQLKKVEEENLDGCPCPEDLSSDQVEDVTVEETRSIYLSLGGSEAELKDEILGSAGSNSTSKDTNLGEVPIYMGTDAPSCSEKVSPTASMSSDEDIKTTEEADLNSDPVQLVDVKHEDITPQTKKVPSTLSLTGLSCSVDCQEVMSAVIEDDLVAVSNRSSEDNKAAEESGLTSVSLQLVDVADKDVTPESVMEIESPSKADNKNVSSSVGTGGTSAGGRVSKIFKKMKSAWKTSFRSKPRRKVQLTTGQDLVDAVKLESSDSKSVSPCPDEASPTVSIHFSEDNKAAEESGLTCVPLELVDVADKDVAPQEKEASEPSTLSSVPPSEQDRRPEGLQEVNGSEALPQLVGLKNVFYTMIKGFFDSLTEEDLGETSKGVYNTNVKDKLARTCAEVLRLVIETLTDVLSQATNPLGPPDATLTRSPTSSQAVRQNLVFTEDTLQQSLKTTLGEAYCEAIGTDKSVGIKPTFTEAVMRAIHNEVNSVLSETGPSSHVCPDTRCKLSSCRACNKMLVIQAIKSLLAQFQTRLSEDDRLTDEHAVKIHKKKSPWWICLRNLLKKKKVHPVSDEQMDQAVTFVSSGLYSSPQATSSIGSKPSSRRSSTPLEIVDYASEDEDLQTVETGNSISWSPTAHLEDKVSQARSTTPTEVGSSFGDPGSGTSDVGTEQGVPAASGPEANETQAEKGTRICPYCKRKMDADETASAQDEAVPSKRSSLLQRFWVFCRRQSCGLGTDPPPSKLPPKSPFIPLPLF
ncbi:uncharacterized protein LOC117940004 [Etheostoma cragini]|uniref:uncharacterized protein LOC117940004 n=1 Tax=Etheostoma cragini TaxID=417921 RepID=UPI00155F3189|nr:uncharacterized protein LOC117940004 [Etheostoma cragini]